MNRTSNGSSYLSGVLDVFRGKRRKIKATTAKQSSPRLLGRQRQSGPAEAYPYRAAEIVSERGACAAAVAVAEMRFLLRDVPLIPLADCTSPHCTCTYVRYKDRRDLNTNRRAEFSMLTRLYTTHGNTDRRRQRGRRGEDKVSKTEFDFSNWD